MPAPPHSEPPETTPFGDGEPAADGGATGRALAGANPGACDAVPLRGVGPPPPEVALDGWVEAFREYLVFERRASPHTVVAYCADVKALFATATRRGVEQPQGLTADYLRAELTRLRNRHGARLGPRSIARKQSALRAFYRWVLRCTGSRHRHDPTALLMPPKQPKRLPRALGVFGALSLVQPPPASARRARRDHAALLLMYGCGLRRSEVLSVKVCDLDLESRQARVLGKGRKHRIVPIPKGCVEGLRAWQQVRPAHSDETFIIGPSGRAMAPRTLARVVQRAALRAVGHHVTPHQLRHSFATHLLQDGANLRAIQNLLGHAQLASTQVYTEVEVAHLSRVYLNAHPRSRPR